MGLSRIFKKKKLKGPKSPSEKNGSTEQPPLYSGPKQTVDIIEKSTSPAFQEAWKQHWKDLSDEEKAAWSFETPLQVQKTTEEMDKLHREHSIARRIASRALLFLQVVNSLMDGATIGIQAQPEVSSIVLGVIRVVINAAIKYFEYYEKLTEMMGYIADLLKTLNVFDGAKSNEPQLHETLVSIYANVLAFCRHARRAYLGHGDFAKVQWVPFEEQYRQIQTNLKNHTQNLSLVSTAIIMKSTSALEENMIKQASLDAQNERREFLEWISQADITEIHKIMSSKRYKDTGSWLLKTESFVNWTEDTDRPILWLNGPAGTGKTILSSVAINHLRETSKSTEDTVIYTYFKGEDASMSCMPVQMMANLVKQLCWNIPHLPGSVIKFYHDFRMNAQRPSFDDLEYLFQKCSASFRRVFVVIDGLDECEEKYRKRILRFVTGIGVQSGNVKTFVASRGELDILRTFRRHRVLYMSSQHMSALQDIEEFVKHRVGTELNHIKHEVQEEVIKTLVENSKGMYLWVDLQLNELAQVPESDIRTQLKMLPTGLEDTYLAIFRRMMSLPRTTRDLIQTCFLWALNSKEIDTSEFIDGVSLKHKMSSEPTSVYRVNELQEITFGLLTIGNRFFGRVRPIHFSLQEFYMRPSQKHPPDLQELLPEPDAANAKMAIMCLQHLLLDQDPPELFSTCIFYCAKWFDNYIRSLTTIPEELWNILDRIFLHEPESMKRIMACKYPSQDHDGAEFVCLGNPRSLDRTTFMRCTGLDLVPAIWSRYKEVEETPRDFPADYLFLAAALSLDDILNNIISQGIYINRATPDRWTALHLADLSTLDPTFPVFIERSGTSVTKILLDAGADWNFDARHIPSERPREEYKTPLNDALYHNHYPKIKTIVRHGSFNFATYMKSAPLKDGAGYIKVLIEQGADINQRDEYGDTALQIAIEDGREDCVKVLEELGGAK